MTSASIRRSRRKFTTTTFSSEDEGEDEENGDRKNDDEHNDDNVDGDDDVSSLDSYSGECDDVLNEPPERMLSPSSERLLFSSSRSPHGHFGGGGGVGAHSYAHSHSHASLNDLSRVSQMVRAGGTLTTPQATNPFPHSSTIFTTHSNISRHPQSSSSTSASTASLHSRSFHIAQPRDFSLDEPDDADDRVLASSTSQPLPAEARQLELEYEHLQMGIQKLREKYDHQLANEIEVKMRELDVALALSLGIDSFGSALSSSSASRVASTNMRELRSSFEEAHRRHVKRVQEEMSTLHASHAKVLTDVRAKLDQNESKIEHILAHNHAAVTRLRDDAIKAAKAAAEAERKRLEEEAAAAAKEAERQRKLAEEAAEAEASRRAREKADQEARAKQASEDAAAALAKTESEKKAAADAAALAKAQAAAASPSAAAIEEMAQRKQALEQCRASYGAWLNEPTNKNRKLQIMMHINRQVAQVVGTVSQVQMKAKSLLELLAQAQSTNSAEYAYCLDMIATKIVSFTKSKVRLQNSAAFPLAMVALYIAVQHPTFTDIFVASLGEKCIYITPVYLAAKSYPNTHAYMLALGYEEIASETPGTPPTVDTEEQYFERVVGYVCMYAAFIEFDEPRHTHGAEYGWKWLARILNQKPRSATASALYAFLSTAAHGLLKKYPTQMRKLLQFVNTDFINRLDLTTPSRKAAVAVLALWLQTTLHLLQTTGQIPMPEGKNMPMSQESDTSHQELHEGD